MMLMVTMIKNKFQWLYFLLGFYLVGGCKYKMDVFTYNEYHKTRVKLNSLKENATFYYALFSKSGFKDRLLQEAKENQNLKLYTLSEIVNYK